MKRHETLIPLTHDHHHALAQVRRLRRAADQDVDERRSVCDHFLRFFNHDTVEHFRQEEELIFPLAAAAGEAQEVLERALVEHVVIHAAVRSLQQEQKDGGPTPEAISKVSGLLEEHIRFEEKVVFPLLQSIVPEADLAAVTLPPRSERTPPDPVR